jgi:hypothetical protein
VEILLNERIRVRGVVLHATILEGSLERGSIAKSFRENLMHMSADLSMTFVILSYDGSRGTDKAGNRPSHLYRFPESPTRVASTRNLTTQSILAG